MDDGMLGIDNPMPYSDFASTLTPSATAPGLMDFGTQAGASALKGYQGMAPSSGGMPGWGAPMIGAGIQAAGTTAKLISDAVDAQRQREFVAEQGGLDRDTKRRLVTMQLKEHAWEANQQNQQNAYAMLNQAYANQMSNTYHAVANKRAALNSTQEILSAAYLR